MQDLIIIGILAVVLLVGIRATMKHFKNKSGCCGSGSNYISKKKLANVIAKKTFQVDGMMCENCEARVVRAINDIDGLAAKVNLKKKEVVVSMERKVSDEVIKAAIEKVGYTVLS